MSRRYNDKHCDVLIVGSGPGGVTSALQLARAGRDVHILEEGRLWPRDIPQSYSLEEQQFKYRNVGLTPALGKIKVPYIEACCVGGASEINAGLYHSPISEVLEEWGRTHRVKNLTLDGLRPYLEKIEKEMGVSRMPQGVGTSSKILSKGAEVLKWKATEVPRFWRYEDQAGTRQSMTQSLLPMAQEAGCRLTALVKVLKIGFRGKRADHVVVESREGRVRQHRKIYFDHIIVSGGAIQTPALLRRSGIKRNIGDSLAMHPAVRIVADFKRPVYDEQEGVPVVQVQEFKPKLTLGGSFSGLAHAALWLSGQQGMREKLSSWKNMAIFYALIMSTSRGSVRNFPIFNEAFVRMTPTPDDLKAMGEGLYRLGELLFAAGAIEIYPPVAGWPVFRNLKDMEILRQGLPAEKADLSTIHLFSSCPMGEDLSKCAVDSYGKLHGYENVYLNDASILPGPPGVNPQALIMAIARRNIDHFLKPR